MSNENIPGKIYEDSIHYLDFGSYPLWLNILYQQQIASRSVQELSNKLLSNLNPTDGIAARMKTIQQYIHDETYHISPIDRVNLYGYIGFESVPYGDTFIKRSYTTIINALVARNNPEGLARVEENIKLKRFVGSKNGPLEKSIELLEQFRGKPALQCAEESTLSAALCLYVGGIPENRIVFIGSPVHVATFVRPQKGLTNGCLFDSKMLYFPNDMKKFGTTPHEKRKNYIAPFGGLWFAVNAKQYINFELGESQISEAAKTEILDEINNFFELSK